MRFQLLPRPKHKKIHEGIGQMRILAQIPLSSSNMLAQLRPLFDNLDLPRKFCKIRSVILAQNP